MPPELAVAALGPGGRRGDAVAVVADVDWERFVPTFTLARPSPLLGDLPEVRDILAAVGESGPADPASRRWPRRLAGCRPPSGTGSWWTWSAATPRRCWGTPRPSRSAVTGRSGRWVSTR